MWSDSCPICGATMMTGGCPNCSRVSIVAGSPFVGIKDQIAALQDENAQLRAALESATKERDETASNLVDERNAWKKRAELAEAGAAGSTLLARLEDAERKAEWPRAELRRILGDRGDTSIEDLIKFVEATVTHRDHVADRLSKALTHAKELEAERDAARSDLASANARREELERECNDLTDFKIKELKESEAGQDLLKRAAERDSLRAEVDSLKGTLGRNWKPTVDAINALPEPLRRFIMELETNADPAGMVRDNVLLRDERAMLESALAEERRRAAKLEGALGRVVRFALEVDRATALAPASDLLATANSGELSSSLAPADEARGEVKIDIRPSCIKCGAPWMPGEGVNAQVEACPRCEVLAVWVGQLLAASPLPWRIEQDWAWEVLDAQGAEVFKLRTCSHAEALIALANEVSKKRADGERHIQELIGCPPEHPASPTAATTAGEECSNAACPIGCPDSHAVHYPPTHCGTLGGDHDKPQPMTYGALKRVLENLSPEQLAMPVRWYGEGQSGAIEWVDILDEDHTDRSGEAWEPVSVYANDPEPDADIVARKGQPMLKVLP